MIGDQVKVLCGTPEFVCVCVMIGDQVKVLCGTPEFVAPEVVNYDFISTGSGEIFNQVNTENSYHICFALLRTYVSEIGREYIL